MFHVIRLIMSVPTYQLLMMIVIQELNCREMKLKMLFECSRKRQVVRPNGLSRWFFKNFAFILATIMTELYSKILENGILPVCG